MSTNIVYHKAARACIVRQYIHHQAKRYGAPRDLEDELVEAAINQVLGGTSAWRAIRSALEELGRRADVHGWWGIEQ